MVLLLKEKLTRIEAVKIHYSQELAGHNGALSKVATYGESKVFWMEPGYVSPKGYRVVTHKDHSLVVTGDDNRFGRSVGEGDYIVAYPSGVIEVMSDQEIHTKYIVEEEQPEENSHEDDL